MKRTALSIALATCVLGASALSASAAIVCNKEGDCWHVKGRTQYKPEFGLTIHGDSWKWRGNDGAKYRWREHEGRGYWNNGVWVTF